MPHAAPEHAPPARPRPSAARPSRAPGKRPPAVGPAAQRALGNRAFGRYVQAKLTVNRPGDRFEREADRVADKVLRMPVPAVQRACACGGTCAACRDGEDHVHTKPASARPPAATPALAAHVAAMKGGGHPLPAAERAYLEPRFGRDFGHVRLHTDRAAADAARGLSARAFTTGGHIAFGAGAYAPGTTEGRRLLAHELTHVVQQGATGAPALQRYTDDERATCECLDWSVTRTYLSARAMVTGGEFTGRPHAALFMRRFLDEDSSDAYVSFFDFASNEGGRAALDDVNARVSNGFLAEADGLPCGGTRSDLAHTATTPGHFTHGTDLFYAMGAFTLRATATGSAEKTCDADGNCTGIAARMDLTYRVDDLYDWKTDPGGCTPSTGEAGCRANTKTVALPVLGVICDECLNRLVIHGWASEFMVKVRGRAEGYEVSGPCGHRNPTGSPTVRDNQRADP
jgi:hypothetical protein